MRPRRQSEESVLGRRRSSYFPCGCRAYPRTSSPRIRIVAFLVDRLFPQWMIRRRESQTRINEGQGEME